MNKLAVKQMSKHRLEYIKRKLRKTWGPALLKEPLRYSGLWLSEHRREEERKNGDLI